MNKEKLFGTESSHDLPATQRANSSHSEGQPAKNPGKEPVVDASKMDALVSEFLEELNMVSAELGTTHKPETPVGGRNKRRSSGSQSSLAFELDDEADDREAIDAELAKTLLELEGRPKSNVIPLTIRDSARPQSQSATVAEIFAAPESLLMTHSEEAPAAPAAVPARPEIRFIPAANVGEKPEDKGQPGKSVDIRGKLRSFALPKGKVILCIAIPALLAAAVFAYQYFSSNSAKAGSPPPAPVVQQAAISPGGAAKPAAEPPAGNAATTADVPGDRRWVEQSASANVAPPRSRGNSSLRVSPAGQSGSAQAAVSNLAANAGVPPAGQSEAAVGATGSGGNPVQPAAPGVTGSRGSETPQPGAAEAQRPATPPAPQPAAQQTTTARSISEALPAGLTQIPAMPRTAPFATAPPPGNLANLESRTEAGSAKINPATLATPAVPLVRVSPQYPATASRIQAKGKVDLTVEVDERGNVTRATAINGPLVLRPAAEEALMKWRFKAATLRGANIRSEVTISVEFKQ